MNVYTWTPVIYVLHLNWDRTSIPREPQHTRVQLSQPRRNVSVSSHSYDTRARCASQFPRQALRAQRSPTRARR